MHLSLPINIILYFINAHIELLNISSLCFFFYRVYKEQKQNTTVFFLHFALTRLETYKTKIL